MVPPAQDGIALGRINADIPRPMSFHCWQYQGLTTSPCHFQSSRQPSYARSFRSRNIWFRVLVVSFYSLWLRTRRQFPANSPFTQNYVQAQPSTSCDTLGARSRPGTNAAKIGADTGRDAHTSPDCRTPVRHDQILDGCNSLPDQNKSSCEHGDEFACAGLQYEADDEYTRGGIAVEGSERVSALTSCYRRSDLASFRLRLCFYTASARSRLPVSPTNAGRRSIPASLSFPCPCDDCMMPIY